LILNLKELNMPKLKIVMVLYLAGTLLVSGCASSRMVTDLKPANNAELKSPAGTFYVADVKFIRVLDNPKPNTIETYKKYQRLLLPLLRKECMERYPVLFSNDAASSIPISVTAESTLTPNHFKTKCWMFGTLMIVGWLLPCPSEKEEDVILKAGIWTGRDDVQGAMLQKCFRRETHGWLSILTPLALIDIPGESDFPKASSSIFTTHKGEWIYLQQLASQLATALAETIPTQEPAFWTAQPRMSVSPTLTPGRPEITPAILMPTETVDPF
jgi:hypothetical protein